MQIAYERCCGLDIHKKLVVACLIVLAANGQRHVAKPMCVTRSGLRLVRRLEKLGYQAELQQAAPAA
jgi:hypothetical protein